MVENRISIAMATYNGAKYIREQIDSILSQTLQDFELIICDDCSTDNTVDIINKYAQEDPRIRFYKNKENLGFKKNFEKAIGLCHGEYIALCDQDDVWMPNHLEILLSLIGNKMIACGNADLIDSNGKRFGLTLKEMEAFDSEFDDDLKKAYSIIYFRSPYQGASMLIKKDFFKVALPIPDDIGYHDSWFSMLSCFYGGMTYTNTIVNKYRMHGDNATGMRIKRKSKFKNLVYQLVYAHAVFDRPAMVRTVQERVHNLSEDQESFLDDANRILNRASSLWGRLLNTMFRISNYKMIYNCK